jgi:hypothetical protein
VFSFTGKCFPLTGKCFPLTNFFNGKQTQESLESGFPESEFRETNMALVVNDDIVTEVCAGRRWVSEVCTSFNDLSSFIRLSANLKANTCFLFWSQIPFSQHTTS